MGFKNYLITIAFTIIFTLTAFPTLLGISQYVETSYFPVVTDVEDPHTRPTPDNNVVVWGQVKKKRDCTFENLSFYKKTRWGEEMVASERLIPKRWISAPKGEYDFGPYQVNMTENELQNVSSIKFIHKCHPFYLTESVVYNKGKLN